MTVLMTELENDRVGVVIDFITKTPARNDFDDELQYWQEAGLKVPSWVRTSKPLTILKRELRTQIMRETVKYNQKVILENFMMMISPM
jgi:hypothetical protein